MSHCGSDQGLEPSPTLPSPPPAVAWWGPASRIVTFEEQEHRIQWPDLVTGRRSGIRGVMHRRLVLLQDQHDKRRDKESEVQGSSAGDRKRKAVKGLVKTTAPPWAVTGHWLKSAGERAAQGLEPEGKT